MAKTQSDEMRVKRGEAQVTALFDPTQALSGLEPLLTVSNKLLESWAAMSSELLEFGRSRIDRSIEASKALARSASIDEAMDLHADYTRSAVSAYFAEAGKLADLGTRAMLESLSAWQPAMRSEMPQRRESAAA